MPDLLTSAARLVWRPVLMLGCLALASLAGAQEAASEPSGAKKVEGAVVRGAQTAASGVERGVSAAARGVEKGASAAARGIERGVEATGRGIKRGAEATSRAAERVVEKVTGRPATPASAPASGG